MTTPDPPVTPAAGEQPAVLDAESQPAPVEAEAPMTSKSRLSGLRNWLSKRADTSLARLALLWFHRYFEASRNSGASAATYVTLSVLPAGLVFIALFNLARGDENAYAHRLITHMRLDGKTASIVSDLFGTTSDNVLAAAITVVIGFLIWGLSIGQLYQDLYARAWRIQVNAPTDQLFFVIFFFVFSLVFALAAGSAAELRSAGWFVVIPVWIIGSLIFWLWVPRFLLHRKIPTRSLLPGAGLATFVLGGTLATSPLWIGPTLNQNGESFGSFGVVIGLLAYIFIAITLSMVCAVFAPVWAEWWQGERERKEPGARAEPADVGSEPATLSGSAGSAG
jgi:uncharacterized BrkB/YihY/UPF0761 family membrane protein